MAFYVGQKVVCIDDQSPNQGQWRMLPIPVQGAVYTVRAYGQRPTDESPTLLLEEIIGELTPDGVEYAPMARRFRPVIGRKTETGMAILKELLDRESFDDRMPENTY